MIIIFLKEKAECAAYLKPSGIDLDLDLHEVTSLKVLSKESKKVAST